MTFIPNKYKREYYNIQGLIRHLFTHRKYKFLHINKNIVFV